MKTKTNRHAEPTDQLINVICQRTMQCVARLAQGSKGMDHAKLCGLLKAEVLARYGEICRDMKEASEAFPGNEAMLNQVLNVGCLEMAGNAWEQYQAEALV